jgi:hypothetical protein
LGRKGRGMLARALKIRFSSVLGRLTFAIMFLS